MFSFMKNYPNTAQRRFYSYAAGGFLILFIGYMVRGAGIAAHPLLVLLLSVAPNLFGSFATPYIIAFLLLGKGARAASVESRLSLGTFIAINVFVFVACLFIEYLHIAANLGVWDWNDIAASLVGGLLSLLVFLRGRSARG